MADSVFVYDMKLGDVMRYCQDHWCGQCPFHGVGCFLFDRIPAEWHGLEIEVEL